MILSTVKLDDIRVGKRLRQDAGDMVKLAKSIEAVGLLQPIVISRNFDLIAGYRRMQAVRMLGRQAIECVKVDGLEEAAEKLQAEHDENVCRKAMTRSEQAMLYKALKELESQAAAERKKATAIKGEAEKQKRKNHAENPVTGNSRNREPDAKDRAAKQAGIGDRKTAEKALAVVEAAQDAPAEFAHVVEAMDSGELSVAAAHREVARKTATTGRLDSLGREVPEHLLVIWEAGQQMKAALQTVGNLHAQTTRLLTQLGEADDSADRQKIARAFKELKLDLEIFLPAVVVPQDSNAQQRWKDRGWITQRQFDALPKSIQAEWEPV